MIGQGAKQAYFETGWSDGVLELWEKGGIGLTRFDQVGLGATDLAGRMECWSL